MKYRTMYKTAIGGLAAMALILSGRAAAEETYLSPLALAVQGEMVYVAEFTANQIAVFDATKNEVAATISLPGSPTGLVAAPDGTKLYVTGGGPDGQVYVIDLSSNQVVGTHPAGHTPKSPAITPDGQTLLVCSQFNDCITAIDITGSSETKQIPVAREPVAAVLALGGARLVVANLLPAVPADADYVSARVDVIDVSTKRNAGTVSLPNGSSSLLGICTSPDGAYVYVTHILSRYQLPTTQLERGWTNTNAVSIIDVANSVLVNTVLLDDVDLGAANPWGVVCTEDGKWLCVAHSGTHELSVIDREMLHTKLADAATAGEAESVPNDLAFLVGLRKRVRLPGKGPRGVAVLGSRVFAAEYFSGTLASVDLPVGARPQSQSFALGSEPAMSAIRAGEAFFHDGSVCFQQWQSCASCHPGDGRVDALNWDLLNDGMGNPKNTKSLLLCYDTPPTTATGVRDNAMTSTRSGIRFILFNQVPEEQAVSVDEYLKALTPVPSPRLVEGQLSQAAVRGARVFDSAGCGNCHPAPLFTDMKGHNVGMGTGREADALFDTPSLIEIWRTAPYLHDGRALTLDEMIRNFNRMELHGKTAALTADEVADLVEYLLSL